MILTSIFIISGVSYLGSKLYSSLNGKDGLPSLVPASSNRSIANNVKDRHVDNMSPQQFDEQPVRQAKNTLAETYEPQVLQSDGADFEDSDIGTIEQWIGPEMVISTVSVGFALAGTLFFPPLMIGSVACLGYLSIDIFKKAYRSMSKKRRVDSLSVEVIFLLGLLVSGNFLVASASFWATYLSLMIISRAKSYSMKKLTHVFNQQPGSAWVLREGIEVSTPIDELQAGDIVVAQAGEVMPVDGKIIHGMAEIDERMLTGESQPAEKSEGAPVFSTTIILSGSIHVRVEKAGSETLAAEIGQILSETSNFAASVELRCVEAADKWALPHLVVSGLAYPFFGLQGALSILWAPYDDSMFMGGPLGVLSYLSIASNKGLLVKDGRALEALNDVDMFVFDKTGTLTLDQPHVGDIHVYEGFSADEILSLAGAAEHKQTHPVALAILKAARDRDLLIPSTQEAEYEIGYGIKVRVGDGDNESVIKVGSANFMHRESIVFPHDMKEIETGAHRSGFTLVFVAREDQLIGAIELRVTVRDEAKNVIDQLKKREYEIAIISGDHEEPTKALAEQIGIDLYFAGVLPQQKAELIENLQRNGKSVCFVGDGINDAIALKKANVSVSLNGASAIAVDTAEVILMEKNLGNLIDLIDLAKDLKANVKRTMLSGVIPTGIIIGGVFFFHLSMAKAAALYVAGVTASTVNSVSPLLNHKITEQQRNKKDLKDHDAV